MLEKKKKAEKWRESNKQDAVYNLRDVGTDGEALLGTEENPAARPLHLPRKQKPAGPCIIYGQ